MRRCCLFLAGNDNSKNRIFATAVASAYRASSRNCLLAYSSCSSRRSAAVVASPAARSVQHHNCTASPFPPLQQRGPFIWPTPNLGKHPFVCAGNRSHTSSTMSANAEDGDAVKSKTTANDGEEGNRTAAVGTAGNNGSGTEETTSNKDDGERSSNNKKRNTGNKKWKFGGNSGSCNKKNKNNRKKGRKRGRPDWDAEDDEAERGSPKEVHPGSYANPALRSLLGVELPEHARVALEEGRSEKAPSKDDNSDDDGADAGTKNKKVAAASDAELKPEAGIDGAAAAATATATEVKGGKRKVAFLLGYLGTGYSGFQMNEEQKTLQAEFELALLKCGLLSAQNFGYPFKYGWSTSGRTDKGVHACSQVCSCKIHLKDGVTLDQVREELNANLPDQFRVLDIVRTTRSFCAKIQRDRVRYQYMIPSFALTDVNELRGIFEAAGCSEDVAKARSSADPLTAEEVAAIQPKFKDVRSTPEQRERLRTALGCYEGTHSFHNFTKGVSPREDRAKRYIVSFRVEDPIVCSNGFEWIPTQVMGQSFLLHQIRKMVSLAIDAARNACPVDTIGSMLSEQTVTRLNTAPAQGLFMEMSFYNGYNKRKQGGNRDLQDIDWDDENSDAHERWKHFRERVIMEHIASEEQREANFIKYLFIQEHFFDYEQYYQLKTQEQARDEAGKD